MRKIFHLEIKADGTHKYYGSLSALCSENQLGVSKYTLDRFDFDFKNFENETCIIRKSFLRTTGNVEVNRITWRARSLNKSAGQRQKKMKIDNCIYLKKYYSDDDTIIAIDKTKIETAKLSETYDAHGLQLGHEKACDYSLLNSDSNAESDLINAISKNFNIDAPLVNIQAHGSGNSMSFTIQEGDGAKYGFDEERINRFIEAWRKENEVFTECEAYTFWNGSNFESIIVSCDLDDFPLDYEKVDVPLENTNQAS